MEIGNDLIIEDCASNGLGVGLVVKEYVQNRLDNNELFELNTNFKLEEKDISYKMWLSGKSGNRVFLRVI